MLDIMIGTTQGVQEPLVINLAEYRDRRGPARESVSAADRLLARRLPTPRGIAHRRRMLEHLATTSAVDG